MSRTRAQRRKVRKGWLRAVICGAVMLLLLAATTVACARAAKMADEPAEISEEYRWYLDSQKPPVPQTWDELAAAMEVG